MLTSIAHGRGPLLIMLHWLGGSARTWTEVSLALAEQGMRCVALDLPGFGMEADLNPADMAESAEAILRTIHALRPNAAEPWVLAGHSMGGKFAAIVARAARDGRAGLENLAGLVLVSPSPPGVEPIKDSTRRDMIASLGQSTRDAARDRSHADAFVEDNLGRMPLLEAVRTRAVDDVLRMNRKAFVAWLTSGSNEDWGARVGQINLPTLLLAGTEESALGPEAQQRHTLPHFPGATLVPLLGGGHLGPLERPGELASRIVDFVRRLGLPLASTGLPAGFRAVIESNRTSPQTRSVLLHRLADDRDVQPGALSEEARLTLRAVAARIVPLCPFDLASRIDRWLGKPQHDGWRYDELPPDLEAWQTGLDTLHASAVHLHGVGFLALDPPRQDAILRDAQGGDLSLGLRSFLESKPPAFDSSRMRLWFGDMHAELTRTYVADPRTMSRIGFEGFADEHGFTQIGLGGPAGDLR